MQTISLPETKLRKPHTSKAKFANYDTGNDDVWTKINNYESKLLFQKFYSIEQRSCGYWPQVTRLKHTLLLPPTTAALCNYAIPTDSLVIRARQISGQQRLKSPYSADVPLFVDYSSLWRRCFDRDVVLAAVTIITSSRNVSPCFLMESYWHFGGAGCFILQVTNEDIFFLPKRKTSQKTLWFIFLTGWCA
jgi:hypothetical protein